MLLRAGVKFHKIKTNKENGEIKHIMLFKPTKKCIFKLNTKTQFPPFYEYTPHLVGDRFFYERRQGRRFGSGLIDKSKDIYPIEIYFNLKAPTRFEKYVILSFKVEYDSQNK